LSLLPFIDGDGTVARRDGATISRGCFLGDIQTLADALPERSFVVNFCVDRVRFAIGLAAAMSRGQVTLLPSDGSAGAVAGLLGSYPDLYALVDSDTGGLPCPCFAMPESGTGDSDVVPAFPPEQIAAVLFTSGSTGRPVSGVRRWGRLVAGSRAAGAALGVARHRGAAVVATVPHAHSYGLESAVMLPLLHGMLLDAERPFFPADVAAALRGGGVLVTTPVHLRTLVNETASAGFVLSATAPLSEELASRVEAAFAAPVFEIYGCSEAGQLATRRTVDGPVWRCLDGFALRHDAAGAWAQGPGEEDVLLADRIEPAPDGFLLRGRAADQINIAGKRGSLAHLTARLLAIEGVEDGVFVAPEDGDATPRLAALAVAPGLDAAGILARLRPSIDAAFLPRPLRVVAALPRDSLGKLPRTELLRLLEPAPLTLRFAADHPAGPGHFPNDPIIPGAVLLDALLPVLLAHGAAGGRIEAVKFHAPVRPGDAVEVSVTATRFEGRLAGSDRLVFSGAMRPLSPRA